MIFRRARPIQHVAVVGLMVYISLIGGATYGDTNLFLRGLQHLLLTSLVIGWLVHLIRRQRPFPRTPLDIPLFLYIVWLMITTVASHDWRVSLEQSWQYIIHVLIFYMLADFMRQGRQRWIFEGMFLVAALVVWITFFELASWYFGLGFAASEYGWFEIGGFSDPVPPYFRRLALAMNVATWLGNYAVMLLPIVAAWAVTARRRDDRRALALLSLGLILVLILSFSRGALLGSLAVIGIIIMGGLLHNPRRRTWVIRHWWAVAAGLMLLVGAGSTLIWYMSQGAGRISGDQGRLDLWQGALDITRDHPLTGVGVFQFGYFKREYVDLSSTTDRLRTAHNLYLNTAAEIGIPGLLLMATLAGIFLWCWWREWQSTSPGRQIRLIAVLAALAAFSIQSLVDTFTYTSTVLPVFVAAAYVLAGQYTPVQKAAREEPAAFYGWLRYVAIAGVALYLIWLLRIDLAQLRLLQSIAAMGQEDYEVALDRIEAAQDLDPHLRLYNLQKANILGLLAKESPEGYLDQAIEQYESILDTDPNFDVGWANLSALYAQRGEHEQAIAAIQTANRIRRQPIYLFILGRYHEALGQDEEAATVYYSLLASSPFDYAPSDYWRDVDQYPARQAAMEMLINQAPPAESLYAATVWGWETEADQLAQELAEKDDSDRLLALGYYALAQEDYEASVDWFQQAAEYEPTQPEIYVGLGEAYLAQGTLEEAEQAAKTALYLEGLAGRKERAHFILARIAIKRGEPDEISNDHLIKAVPVRFVYHIYDDSVFGRMGYLDYLPQLAILGRGQAAYEPWLLLAERFAADNDTDTDPINVYKAILREEPYFEEVRDLCGTAC